MSDDLVGVVKALATARAGNVNVRELLLDGLVFASGEKGILRVGDARPFWCATLGVSEWFRLDWLGWRDWLGWLAFVTHLKIPVLPAGQTQQKEVKPRYFS